MPNLASGCGQDEIAIRADGDLAGTLEFNPDRGRVDTRLQFEVIFQFPAFAVIDEIDAGINAFISYLLKVRN